MKKVFIILGVILLSIMICSCGKKYEKYEDSESITRIAKETLIEPFYALDIPDYNFEKRMEMLENDSSLYKISMEVKRCYVVGYLENIELEYPQDIFFMNLEYEDIKWYKFNSLDEIPQSIGKMNKLVYFEILEGKIIDLLSDELQYDKVKMYICEFRNNFTYNEDLNEYVFSYSSDLEKYQENNYYHINTHTLISSVNVQYEIIDNKVKILKGDLGVFSDEMESFLKETISINNVEYGLYDFDAFIEMINENVN